MTVIFSSCGSKMGRLDNFCRMSQLPESNSGEPSPQLSHQAGAEPLSTDNSLTAGTKTTSECRKELCSYMCFSSYHKLRTIKKVLEKREEPGFKFASVCRDKVVWVLPSPKTVISVHDYNSFLEVGAFQGTFLFGTAGNFWEREKKKNHQPTSQLFSLVFYFTTDEFQLLSQRCELTVDLVAWVTWVLGYHDLRGLFSPKWFYDSTGKGIYSWISSQSNSPLRLQTQRSELSWWISNPQYPAANKQIKGQL